MMPASMLPSPARSIRNLTGGLHLPQPTDQQMDGFIRWVDEGQTSSKKKKNHAKSKGYIEERCSAFFPLLIRRRVSRRAEVEAVAHRNLAGFSSRHTCTSENESAICLPDCYDCLPACH